MQPQPVGNLGFAVSPDFQNWGCFDKELWRMQADIGGNYIFILSAAFTFR